jgi:YD repeat-containing protein
MRHFGDSAQPNSNGLANADTQPTAVAKSEAGGNLARFIHDQFSPANRYDLSAPSPYEVANSKNGVANEISSALGKALSNGWGAGERARQQNQEAKDAAVLPALSFTPGQRPEQLPAQWATNDHNSNNKLSSEQHKLVVPNLGNLFSPAPDKNAFLNAASEQNKEALAASVIEDFRSPFESMRSQITISDQTKEAKIAARDVAFEAANCYQTIQINPQEGSTKTITTLSDLSSSRIHIKSIDGSSTTYTDRLGRPISESRYDASGKLISETTTQFENGGNAAMPSKKVIRTANETTEITLDSRGLVLTKTTLPYSDLNNA